MQKNILKQLALTGDGTLAAQKGTILSNVTFQNDDSGQRSNSFWIDGDYKRKTRRRGAIAFQDSFESEELIGAWGAAFKEIEKSRPGGTATVNSDIFIKQSGGSVIEKVLLGNVFPPARR